MSEAQALIPVQQDIVDFDGYPVIGVRLPDGRIGASLRDMCDAMKIDRPSQVQRIRGDETIVLFQCRSRLEEVPKSLIF